MSTAAPRGKRHADCLEHIRHDYARTGWLCIASAEPGRAEAMRAFADHLAAVAARHHAAELARGPADGTHRRLSAEITAYGREHKIPADGLREMRDRLASWTAPSGGTAAYASTCAGHTCAGRPSESERAAEMAAGIVDVTRKRPRKSRPVTLAPEPAREPIAELAADLIAQGRALGILPSPAGAIVPPAAVRATVIDYSRPMPDGFRVDDPFGVLAEPADVLAGVTVITADGTYTGTMRADDSIRVDGPAPDDGPAIVDLAYSAETDDGLAPVSIAEPARPEPAPVRLSIVPPADSQPTCARCGQTFRASGVGLAWHNTNRPDCARARRTA